MPGSGNGTTFSGRAYFRRVSFVVEIPEEWYHTRPDIHNLLNTLRVMSVHTTAQRGYDPYRTEFTYWFDKGSKQLHDAMPFVFQIGLAITDHYHRPSLIVLEPPCPT